jgi:hypothetical protein
MSVNTNLLNLANDMQALNLVSHNYKFATSNKKKNVGDFISMGAKNIVGTSMIKTNADLIGAL